MWADDTQRCNGSKVLSISDIHFAQVVQGANNRARARDRSTSVPLREACVDLLHVVILVEIREEFIDVRTLRIVE